MLSLQPGNLKILFLWKKGPVFHCSLLCMIGEALSILQAGLLNCGGKAGGGGYLETYLPHWTLDKLNGKNMHKCLALCLPSD